MEVALSTTEAELIVMNEGLRTAIPLMNLIEEMMERGIGRFNSCTRVHCKVFEDNAGAMTIATMPKIRPRTKYINGKYWHFRDHLDQGKISIHAVSTKDQIADLLTKPLPENEFTKFKNRIMGKAVDVSAYLQGSVRKHGTTSNEPRATRTPKIGDTRAAPNATSPLNHTMSGQH